MAEVAELQTQTHAITITRTRTTEHRTECTLTLPTHPRGKLITSTIGMGRPISRCMYTIDQMTM